jgi:hypothetical protein
MDSQLVFMNINVYKISALQNKNKKETEVVKY